MKPEELRIGNYVLNVEYENKVLQMTSFFGLCNVETRPEDYAPIQLTDDWLRKLGFEYSEERESMSNGFDEWRKDSIYLGYMYNCYIIDALDQGAINVAIKYVHQLQNLYFALTGEELTINK